MRAAVLESFDAPLHVVERPDPTAGYGQAVVRTRAAGLCRTDLKIISGAIPTVALPRILGHEIAGEVVSVGPGVTEVEPGQHVLVMLDVSCGRCRHCRGGALDHCANLRRLGLEEDGGLAELVVAPAANLIPLPESIDFEQAAVLPDAVGSPYHAIRLAGVGPAQTVAVYGLGGLGLSAVQVARLRGATVIGIARTPARRALAEQLGATWTIDPDDGPVSAQVRALTDGLGVDAFIDLVGIAGSAEHAVGSTRKGGTVVVLGYLVDRLDVPMMRLVYDEIVVRGSRGSTREDMLQVVDLVADGHITPVIGHRLALDEINAGLDRLRAGDVIGRSVVGFSPTASAP